MEEKKPRSFFGGAIREFVNVALNLWGEGSRVWGEGSRARCPCGAIHSRADRRTTQVMGKDFEARTFGDHGALYDLICRACRTCGSVYALTREQDAELHD
jgi:hypothetical protein